MLHNAKQTPITQDRVFEVVMFRGLTTQAHPQPGAAVVERKEKHE